MAGSVRIIGHSGDDGISNEQLQAQVETDGSLRVDILSSYKLADIDIAADPQYFGYINTDGAWYIKEYNVANGTIRYAKSDSGYTLAWQNRTDSESVVYDYYFNVF